MTGHIPLLAIDCAIAVRVLGRKALAWLSKGLKGD